ncbi:MAG: hypothetical protein ACOZNI_31190 [Myxococcota bacterium]
MILLYACVSADTPAELADALARKDCGGLRELRDACLAELATDCDDVGDPTLRGECWFRRAEVAGDASSCPKAVPFADDCAMHVLSRGFAAWVPKGAAPAEVEALAEPRIVAAGLAPDDPRPWSALWRWVLGNRRPLDRASCDAVADPARREACLRTGLALYADLLNQARDRRTFPCDGGPLPPHLAYAPDRELDALVASRTDLCPPP